MPRSSEFDWGAHLDRLSVNRDLAFVLADHAAEDVHQRRLAGAVCAHQRDRLAGMGVEVGAAERDDAGKSLGDAAHLKIGRRHFSPRAVKWSKATKATMIAPRIIWLT